jgi:hypothetical protein
MSDRPTGLLRRLFFRRFFDNDLISPNGGGFDNMGLVFAALATPGLLAAAPLLFKYGNRYITPGRRLLMGLDDKFFFLALSMVVMGIVTVVEWDALALDARDVAILGPLPIPRRTLLAAKLGAIGLFIVAFAAAVTAIPSIVHPLVLLGTLQIGLAQGLWLMSVQAAVSLAAVAFAFFAILGVRQVIVLLLGARWFGRVAVLVQFVLVLALVTALFLLPGHRSVSESMLPGGGSTVSLSPPMWFLGLSESLTGRGVLDSPQVVSPRGKAYWTSREANRSRADYLWYMPVFDRLAGIGLVALAIAALLAVGGYALETRRLVRRASAARSSLPRWLVRASSSAVGKTVVRDPLARATFFFTLQTLARGTSQRFYLAAFGALAFAAIAILVPLDELQGAWRQTSQPTAALLSLQMVLVFCLVWGLRFVFAMPAELRANWMFRVAWTRQPWRYFSGVRRAVFMLAMIALLALAPLHALLWGWQIAAAHFAIGALAAGLLVEAAFLGLRALPFTRAYGSTGTFKFLWPLYHGAFLLCTLVFGRIEAWAIRTPGRAESLAVALGAAVVIVALWRARCTKAWTDIAFDAPDERATQRLGLSADV